MKPHGSIKPTAEEVKAYRVAQQTDVFSAKRALIRRNAKEMIERAETMDQLKMTLGELLEHLGLH